MEGERKFYIISRIDEDGIDEVEVIYSTEEVRDQLVSILDDVGCSSDTKYTWKLDS